MSPTVVPAMALTVVLTDILTVVQQVMSNMIPAVVQQVMSTGIHGVGTCKRRTYDMRWYRGRHSTKIGILNLLQVPGCIYSVHASVTRVQVRSTGTIPTGTRTADI